MIEIELFFLLVYVEWDVYIVFEFVSLLVIGYCKCGWCRKFICSDIVYGFIFFYDQVCIYWIINDCIGCSGDCYFL